MGFSATTDETRPGAYAVSLEGDLDLGAAGRLKKLLFELISDGAHEIEIDLRRVALVDATTAGVLIIAERALHRRGGTLRLRGWGVDEMDRLAALTEETTTNGQRPRIVFFYPRGSERTKPIEALVASVLRRHRQATSFLLQRVEIEEHPDLAARFGVDVTPTLFVVEGKHVRARIADPRGAEALERVLAPWLRPGKRAVT